jgi:hypothetical protein
MRDVISNWPIDYITMRAVRRTPSPLVPKATPVLLALRVPRHVRLRLDKVDSTGVSTVRQNSKLHHVGLGRRLLGTRVNALVDALRVRVITDDGELIRQTESWTPTGGPSNIFGIAAVPANELRHSYVVAWLAALAAPDGSSPTVIQDNRCRKRLVEFSPRLWSLGVRKARTTTKELQPRATMRTWTSGKVAWAASGQR